MAGVEREKERASESEGTDRPTTRGAGLFYLGEFNNSHRPSFVNSGIIINDGAPESRSAFGTLARTSLLGRECKLITHRDFHEKHIKPSSTTTSSSLSACPVCCGVILAHKSSPEHA